MTIIPIRFRYITSVHSFIRFIWIAKVIWRKSAWTWIMWSTDQWSIMISLMIAMAMWQKSPKNLILLYKIKYSLLWPSKKSYLFGFLIEFFLPQKEEEEKVIFRNCTQMFLNFATLHLSFLKKNSVRSFFTFVSRGFFFSSIIPIFDFLLLLHLYVSFVISTMFLTFITLEGRRWICKSIPILSHIEWLISREKRQFSWTFLDFFQLWYNLAKCWTFQIKYISQSLGFSWQDIKSLRN